MQIDAHHHFWHYNADDYGWIDDSMSVIRRDFLPGDLAAEIAQAVIDGVVSIQARQTVAETEWLLALAAEYPFISGVVSWVPLMSPDVESHLERFSAAPQLKGVRHVLHDEPDDDFMLRSDFNRGILCLRRFNLVYNILIFERHLPQTIEFVDRHPDQVFVVDHIAKPKIRDNEIEPWRRHIHSLAERENV